MAKVNSDSPPRKDDHRRSPLTPEELDRLDRFDCELLSEEERGDFLAELYSSRDKRQALSEMFELELLERPEMERERQPLAATTFGKSDRISLRSYLTRFPRLIPTLSLLFAVIAAWIGVVVWNNFSARSKSQEVALVIHETPPDNPARKDNLPVVNQPAQAPSPAVSVPEESDNSSEIPNSNDAFVAKKGNANTDGRVTLGARSLGNDPEIAVPFHLSDSTPTLGIKTGDAGMGGGTTMGGMSGTPMGVVACAPILSADVAEADNLGEEFILSSFFAEQDDIRQFAYADGKSWTEIKERARDGFPAEKISAIAELMSNRRARPGEYEQYLSELSAEEKASASGLTLFGVQSVIEGDFEKAEQYFRSAFERNRTSAVAMYNLAAALELTGRAFEARSYYEKLRASDEYKQSSSLREEVRRGERLIRELQKTRESGEER
ncbi:MAG: hypothetical protein IJL92_10940 [Thermoguttaceae bacterium]|nr:hypothetical protein [Thermoguttaceae bacterium]